jgi:hypothetical protein
MRVFVFALTFMVFSSFTPLHKPNNIKSELKAESARIIHIAYDMVADGCTTHVDMYYDTGTGEGAGVATSNCGGVKKKKYFAVHSLEIGVARPSDFGDWRDEEEHPTDPLSEEGLQLLCDEINSYMQ